VNFEAEQKSQIEEGFQLGTGVFGAMGPVGFLISTVHVVSRVCPAGGCFFDLKFCGSLPICNQQM
jgi:hypothetical protein